MSSYTASGPLIEEQGSKSQLYGENDAQAMVTQTGTFLPGCRLRARRVHVL